MMFELAIKEQAHRDIQRNAFWWAENHSLDQAIAWQDTIYQQLETLKTMPDRFGIAPENDRFTMELRQQPIGLGSRKTYRAIFTITKNTVHVLAIRRSSEDLLQLGDVDAD